MPSDRLSALQRDIVRALAQRECGFFLTGGGVLVGFVLGHRTTDDLDLFTTDDAAMAQADGLAHALGSAVGATLESLQTTPDHRRYLFSRGGESTRVDFVRDRGVQLMDKSVRDGVAMDAVEEILANKITTLASRSEIRDVVDLYCLEQAGLPHRGPSRRRPSQGCRSDTRHDRVAALFDVRTASLARRRAARNDCGVHTGPRGAHAQARLAAILVAVAHWHPSCFRFGVVHEPHARFSAQPSASAGEQRPFARAAASLYVRDGYAVLGSAASCLAGLPHVSEPQASEG